MGVLRCDGCNFSCDYAGGRGAQVSSLLQVDLRGDGYIDSHSEKQETLRRHGHDENVITTGSSQRQIFARPARIVHESNHRDPINAAALGGLFRRYDFSSGLTVVRRRTKGSERLLALAWQVRDEHY
jgi:hypothetical protein